MLEIIEHDKFREIAATEGYLHRVGDSNYSEVKRAILLPNETIETYEEVMELPKYTEAEYKAKVKELIAEKYSIEDEIALINNMNVKDPKDEHIIEYDEYMTFRDECKNKAKEELNK